jgi:hypothetical protein
MHQAAAQPQTVAQTGPKMNKPQFNDQELKQAEENGDLENTKQIVGTAIYIAIEPFFKLEAGKITGMMIERPDFSLVARQYLENYDFFAS